MARLLPDWITSYLEYTKGQESPEQFHYWSAISTLASVMTRKTWLARGYFTLFPNMYIVLVAESAYCRKSTAISMATELEEATQSEILREKLTVAYLTNHLASKKEDKSQRNAVLVFAPELNVFLGKDAFMTGLIPALISLYDCPRKWEYRTKTGGKDLIYNPCVNIRGATTMDWMSTGLPGEAVEGGFTSRVIFVVGEEPRCQIPWPEVSEKYTEMKEHLALDLIEVSRLAGPFQTTTQAKEMYADWYMHQEQASDPRLKPYFGRKGDHILKVAMAICVSQSNDLLIDASHIEEAMNALHNVEILMPRAFQGVAFSTGAKHVDRVLMHMKKLGGIDIQHSNLLRKNSAYINAKEFGQVIETLEQSDRITISVAGNKKYYSLKGNVKDPEAIERKERY